MSIVVLLAKETPRDYVNAYKWISVAVVGLIGEQRDSRTSGTRHRPNKVIPANLDI
jgi:hypothetical protein